MGGFDDPLIRGIGVLVHGRMKNGDCWDGWIVDPSIREISVLPHGRMKNGDC
jgi:hypothetical protein